jgi:uncharacterized membrane protein
MADAPPQVKAYEADQPKVDFSQYWIEWSFLVAGILIPILSAIIWRTGNAFERSGSLTVFCAAVAEFVTVNRLTKKHILNASRALNGERPWDVSGAAKCVGIAAFVVGLIGTVIWGFGSKVWD